MTRSLVAATSARPKAQAQAQTLVSVKPESVKSFTRCEMGAKDSGSPVGHASLSACVTFSPTLCRAHLMYHHGNTVDQLLGCQVRIEWSTAYGTGIMTVCKITLARLAAHSEPSSKVGAAVWLGTGPRGDH